MQFISVRCLNCYNLDPFARLNSDEIPFCSSCSSTSNLVPEAPTSPHPPPQQQQQQKQDDHDDLIALFNRNLFFSQQQQQQPPPTPPPASVNFSISQHYHHSAHVHPPSPPLSTAEMTDDDDAASQPQPQPQQQQRNSDREYAEYLMSSDLSSPSSLNELEIALAHGVVSAEEYRRSVEGYTARSRLLEDARRHQEMMMLGTQPGVMRRALGEDCSALEMLTAAKSSSGGGVTAADWCNDYYGGVDAATFAMGEDMDEEAPCDIYSGAGGCRLRPFDY